MPSQGHGVSRTIVCDNALWPDTYRCLRVLSAGLERVSLLSPLLGTRTIVTLILTAF